VRIKDGGSNEKKKANKICGFFLNLGLNAYFFLGNKTNKI
jgi:hypothetical protein